MTRLGRSICFLGVAAAYLFMFANIRTTEAGVANALLAIPAVCALFVVMARRDPGRAARAQRSSFFLLAFMIYFSLKLLIDLPDEELRTYSVGTSEGVLFAFVFGWTLSVLVTEMTDEAAHGVRRLLATELLLAASLVAALIILKGHLRDIRSDLFLVQGGRGLYQRPGNLAVMIALMAGMQLVLALEKSKRSLAARAAGALMVGLYVGLAAALMITAQLLGSNTGLIVTLFVALTTAAWIGRADLARWQGKTLLYLRKPSLPTILGRSIPRLALNGVILTTLAAALGFAILHYLRLDYHRFRIFGFSEGSFGSHSLRGRMDILSRSFATQFNYAPVFGNLRADDLTVGAGKYPHSLLSLLSHLGLVGAVLFTLYLIAVYREVKRPGSGSPLFYTAAEYALFRSVILAGLVGYSLIGTFFTWMPLWFALGLLFPPVIMHRAPTSGDYASNARTARSAASPAP